MDDIAIRVSGLSKKYFLSKNKLGLSFTEKITQIFSNKTQSKNSEEFYALKDVSFDIKKGESVGIIGRNGAGKSTLLKILSEVIEPSEGKIEIHGKIASVLEVGMGFHPDLTGRENIYLSGALYGLNKKQINNSFDKIVEFSGVERFIDTPVKHYSSGMYIRLAFSVVTNIDADIFLFDEVLIVGDLSFQLKCHEKIKQLAASDKTVIIVSHNNNDIIDLCSKAMCFDNGRMTDYGDISIIKKYIEKSMIFNPKINIKNLVNNNEESDPVFKNILIKEWPDMVNAPGDERIKIKKIFVNNESNLGADSICTKDKLSVNIEYEKFDDNDYYDIGFFIANLNFIFMACHLLNSNIETKTYIKSGVYVVKAYIDEHFFNDSIISLGFSVVRNSEKVIYHDKNVLFIKINQYLTESEKKYSDYIQSFTVPLRPKMKWEIIRK